MINIPKGTKDVLPQNSGKWQYLERKAREICALYNAKEIRTPTFEHTELFLRSIGDDTDVVNKEMYTFNDKGGRSITLKPEGTASVARSYIENSLDSLSLPLKLFYITPVFRYERPQAGRLREHHQFGAEFYGDSSPQMDLEAISLAYGFLKSVGVSELELNLNSIGCPTCRKEYNAALKKYLSSHLDEMCDVCKERYERNPLRILDCKNESCRNLLKDAPLITDYLCDDCKKHSDTLCELLTSAGIPFKVNPWIVRGLDYYTRTVFEFVTTALGAQGTVCGGGRYDNLVAQVGGKPTPCVGFGLGLERLLMLIEQLGAEIPNDRLMYFVAAQAPEYAEFCRKLVYKLRSEGKSADMDFTGRSLKSQLKYADKQSARYVVIVGGSEIEKNAVTVKDMTDGTQTERGIDEL